MKRTIPLSRKFIRETMFTMSADELRMYLYLSWEWKTPRTRVPLIDSLSNKRTYGLGITDQALAVALKIDREQARAARQSLVDKGLLNYSRHSWESQGNYKPKV